MTSWDVRCLCWRRFRASASSAILLIPMAFFWRRSNDMPQIGGGWGGDDLWGDGERLLLEFIRWIGCWGGRQGVYKLTMLRETGLAGDDVMHLMNYYIPMSPLLAWAHRPSSAASDPRIRFGLLGAKVGLAYWKICLACLQSRDSVAFSIFTFTQMHIWYAQLAKSALMPVQHSRLLLFTLYTILQNPIDARFCLRHQSEKRPLLCFFYVQPSFIAASLNESCDIFRCSITVMLDVC